jgi:hypothetical protein
MGTRAQRVFVLVWMTLGLAGALDHTIAQKILGSRIDLVLPHLKYGYVMFNANPRKVDVYEYAGPDGVRHDLADLVAVPAPGYKRARLGIDLLSKPEYLAEVCYRGSRASHAEYDFFDSEYQVDVDPRRPSKTTTIHCSVHGLAPVAR